MTQLVAEIGNVCDGSLGEAHAYVDAIAPILAPIGAIKFQCHIADAESTVSESFPDRFDFHPQDESRTDYWRRQEWTRPQWKELSDHAKGVGLEVIISPFSIAAIERVASFADSWKVASGEVGHEALIRAMQKDGLGQPDWFLRRIILSSGMSTMEEVRRAWDWLDHEHQLRAIVLQCTTEYPTPPEKVGLRAMEDFQAFCQRVGLSDHSGSIVPGLLAAHAGAEMVEVHVCWDRRQWHPDVGSSLTLSQLAQLAEGIEFIGKMGDLEKDQITRGLRDIAAYTEGKQRADISDSPSPVG